MVGRRYLDVGQPRRDHALWPARLSAFRGPAIHSHDRARRADTRLPAAACASLSCLRSMQLTVREGWHGAQAAMRNIAKIDAHLHVAPACACPDRDDEHSSSSDCRARLDTVVDNDERQAHRIVAAVLVEDEGIESLSGTQSGDGERERAREALADTEIASSAGGILLPF